MNAAKRIWTRSLVTLTAGGTEKTNKGSATAQKAELKEVVGVLELRTWGVAGVSVLVCTRGAVFEMDW